jgi:hypothetical protein
MKKFNEYIENRQLQDPQVIEVYRKFVETYNNVDEGNYTVKKLTDELEKMYIVKDNQRSEDTGAYELTMNELDKLELAFEATLKQFKVVDQMFNTYFQLPRSV